MNVNFKKVHEKMERVRCKCELWNGLKDYLDIDYVNREESRIQIM